MQSQGIDNGLRVPNRAEILWQVNTALAYGTRGVGWFSYWTPQPDQGFQNDENAEPLLIEPHLNAMIDINGNRTKVYDYVKEANFYLKKAGKGLLNWDNTDVARYSEGKLIEGISPIISPSGNNANLVIGTFSKDNLYRIVISNSSWENTADFSLRIKSGLKYKEMFASIESSIIEKEDTIFELTIKPGGSIIIELISLIN